MLDPVRDKNGRMYPITSHCPHESWLSMSLNTFSNLCSEIRHQGSIMASSPKSWSVVCSTCKIGVTLLNVGSSNLGAHDKYCLYNNIIRENNISSSQALSHNNWREMEC